MHWSNLKCIIGNCSFLLGIADLVEGLSISTTRHNFQRGSIVNLEAILIKIDNLKMAAKKYSLDISGLSLSKVNGTEIKF